MQSVQFFVEKVKLQECHNSIGSNYYDGRFIIIEHYIVLTSEVYSASTCDISVHNRIIIIYM